MKIRPPRKITSNLMRAILSRRVASPRLVFAAITFSVLSSSAFAVDARRAEDFVNSIGVNTHFGIFHHYCHDDVILKLRESGIRNVRDKARFTGTFQVMESAFYDQPSSIRQLIVLDGTGAGSTPSSILAGLSQYRINRLLGVEGLNEPDLHAYSWSGITSDTNRGDLSGCRAHQTELFGNFKLSSNENYRAIPILAPAVSWSKKSGFLNSVGFDKLAAHPYLQGLNPGCGWLDSEKLADAKLLIARGQSPKGLWVTEAGYHNALNSQDDHRPVTEQAAGKYIPRLLAVHFNRRIDKTFLYEFMDGQIDPENDAKEQSFGLIRNNRQPKPAYWGVKNLIATLSDDVANGATFQPKAINLTITGTKPENVQSTLLQKANQDFYLLLWQEISGCKVDNRSEPKWAPSTDIVNEPVTVQVGLGGVPGQVELITGLSGSSPVTTLLAAASTVSIQVPDEIVILKVAGLGGVSRRTSALPSGPDLVVSRVWTEPAEPLPGESARIHALVFNRGRSASGTSAVLFKYGEIGSEVSSERPLQALDIGQSVAVVASGSWTVSGTGAGMHTILALCDRHNVVAEANERNNARHITAAVPKERFVEPANDLTAWSQGGVTPWIVQGSSGTNYFVNTNTTSTATLTRLETLDSNWRLDFDYEWRWGENDRDLDIRADVLDNAGHGYRLIVRQGDDNLSAEKARQIQIVKMTSGQPAAVPMGTGVGYNSKGCWSFTPEEGKHPRWKRISMIFDRASKSLSAYVDGNNDGVLEQVIPPTRDPVSATGDFTKISFSASPLNGCSPLLDNIKVTKGMIDLAPGIFFQEDFNGSWPPPGWAVDANWIQRTVGANFPQKFADNGAVDSAGEMLREFPAAMTGSWTLGFDYDWEWAGEKNSSGSYGIAAARVFGDVLDANNNGYRIEVQQGKYGGTEAAGTIRILKIVSGLSPAPLAEGEGYNMAGWQTQGLVAPRFKRVVFSYNAANQTLSALADLNEDGLLEEVISPVRDTTTGSFKKLKFSTQNSWGGTCRPQIDNVELGRVP